MSILFGLSPHETTEAAAAGRQPSPTKAELGRKTDEPHRRRRNSPFRRSRKKCVCNQRSLKSVFHRGQRLSSRLCLGKTLLKRNMMLAVLILLVTIVTKMTSTTKKKQNLVFWSWTSTPLLQNQCYQLYFTQHNFLGGKLKLQNIECKYVHSLVLGRKSNTVPLLTLTFGLGVISIKPECFQLFLISTR